MFSKQHHKNNKPLAIAMICSGFPPHSIGGAEVQCLRVSQKLMESGVRVQVLTPAYPQLKKNECIDGIPVLRPDSFLNPLKRLKQFFGKPPQIQDAMSDPFALDNSKPVSILNAVREFCRQLPFFLSSFIFLLFRGREYQIIHLHNLSNFFGFAFTVIGKMLHRPVLIKDSTMNGINRLEKYPAGQFMQRFILNNASIVAISRYIQNNFRSLGMRETRLFYIPNGIELPELSSCEKEGGYHCLFVGNLHRPIKGFPTLLNAWKMVLDRFPQARLTVIGGGIGKEILSQVQTLGISASVKFVGRVEEKNVRDYLLNSDVFVLPSKREGMSNALIEAMAYGLPCVATNISGSQDLIKTGENGILVPVDDPKKLAEGIIYLFGNPDLAQQMGKWASKTIEKTCDFKVIIPQYLKIYRELT